ncbi:MAG: Uma2 family endonuclease [Gemmataceae bacterium]|nr:Uma2 family endonuclease [Gemmataceae bacterium]
MSTVIMPEPDEVYPDCDGQPIADHTLQFEWIGTLWWNLQIQYAHHLDVFVAADNLIYPVRGSPAVRHAPDTYIAFGRPKGDRGSYKVWDEGGIFPQVVFEVWSPLNRYQQMEDRKTFYERYGAEEYYILYPWEPCHAEGWTRRSESLARIPEMAGWVSPRLGVRFEFGENRLAVIGPDGKPFLSVADSIAEANRLRDDREKAESEPAAVEAERAAVRDRIAKYSAKLRELGLDPDAV